MGMMQWLLISKKPAIKGVTFIPVEIRFRQFFLEIADCRLGSKRLLCQNELSEAREMHNQFINLSKKRKRLGKFFYRLFAFLCISAGRSRGSYCLAGCQSVLPVGNFFPAGGRKNDFFATTAVITCTAYVGYLTF